jgi:hypothetical protein
MRGIVLNSTRQTAAMTRLMLTLLGGFEAQWGVGPPLTVPTRKAQALLAYLALTAGQTHPRDKLASLLWADTPPGAARAPAARPRPAPGSRPSDAHAPLRAARPARFRAPPVPGVEE